MTTTNGYTEEQKEEIREKNMKLWNIRLDLQSQLIEVVRNFKGIVSLDGWQGELEEVFEAVQNDDEEYPYKGVEEVI